RPAAQEVESFAKAVDGVFARADRSSKPDPGGVTIRRLNRVEYNNTIRDLVGIDFQPAEDFPSDDVGHGFDNIGDVLTLSPVLLERYLAAAESVMARAITPDPPKPPHRSQAGRYLEPAGPNVPQTRFRPLTQGRLHTPFSLSMDGEYVVRFRAYAPKVGDEPVKAALLVDGKELKRFDVTAAEEKAAAVYEVTAPLTRGERRVAVQLLNEGKVEDPGAAGVAQVHRWLAPRRHAARVALPPPRLRPRQTAGRADAPGAGALRLTRLPPARHEGGAGPTLQARRRRPAARRQVG